MHEVVLSEGTKNDIDKRMARILVELGNPEPPISHEMISDLLSLDKKYFQKDDPGMLDELWSRLKRGTKQIVQRKGLLLDMLKTMSLRAAYLPDTKRIYIDNGLHPFKKRWGETHECVHGVLPWHKDYMLGDDRHTLTPSCREKLEAEANYGTGRLLFAGDRFKKEIMDTKYSLKTISQLSKAYGNSLTSTLWRLVESTDGQAICAYICPSDRRTGKYISNESDTHFVRSPRFISQFSNIMPSNIDLLVRSYINKNARYFAGESHQILYDDNGQSYLFHFESINNGYSYLTLGLLSCPLGVAVSF